LVGTDLTSLKQWTERLSGRVTYLLENIGLLEIDCDSSQALIHSNSSDQRSNETKFYEILIQFHSDEKISLCCFCPKTSEQGDIQVTHEVLANLGNDLV